MNPARRWLAFLSAAMAAMAAVLAVVLLLSPASAAMRSAAGNGVGAIHSVSILTAGLDRLASAGEGRGRVVPPAQIVAGACVAAEGEVVPVLRYPGKSLPQTAQNMARYMNDNSLDATSTFVRVDAKAAAANRAANRLLYQGGTSMDEFPFASTAQGGPGAYLTQVSIREQRAQGLLLSNFYRLNGVNPGDPYAIWIDWGH